MNKDWVRGNIQEAIEQLEAILGDLDESSEIEECDLAHAYYHLNAAYWGSKVDGDPFEQIEDHQGKLRFRKMPSRLIRRFYD